MHCASSYCQVLNRFGFDRAQITLGVGLILRYDPLDALEVELNLAALTAFIDNLCFEDVQWQLKVCQFLFLLLAGLLLLLII